MKKVIIALLFILALASCKSQNNESNTPPTKAFEDGKVFITDLEDEELEKPNATISSFDDFTYALDYLAYYGVDEKVYFYISDDYSKNFYNPYQEFVKAYNAALIAETYNCLFFNEYYDSNKAIAVKYSISKDIATEKSERDNKYVLVKNYDFKLEGDNNYTPELFSNNKGTISCETSDQLYYLVSNGYLPNPKEGSVAKEIYDEAINVLKKYINSNMTDYQKIRALYDYMTYEIQYDYVAASSEDYLPPKQAYYLEGVFLNHVAVCDGRAKAMSVLLNFIGIDCKRCTGKNSDSDHAWNIVNLDNKWYLLCSTWSQKKRYEIDSNIYVTPSHNMLLTSKDTPYGDDWGYVTDKYKDLYESLEKEEYGLYDHKIKNIDEAKDIIDLALSKSESVINVELYYTGGGKNFETELTNYVNSLNDKNKIYKARSLTNELYEVILFYEGN